MSDIYGSTTITIRTFGGLSISDGKEIFELNLKKQGQVVTVLQYLILNRDRPSTVEELVTLLWDNATIDSPQNALKNLIYRLRNMLNEKFGNTKIEYIVHKRGGYMWNDTVNTFVDVEEFEHFYSMSFLTSMSADNRLKYLAKACECYKGEFMDGVTGLEEVERLRIRYAEMYKTCIYEQVQLLAEMGSYKRLANTAGTALKDFPTDERLAYHYFFALLRDARRTDMILHYEKYYKYFEKTTGHMLSPDIHNLYLEVSRSGEKETSSIEEITEALSEDEQTGAFYCDYDVFKTFYRLQERNAQRTEVSILLMVVTVDIGSRCKNCELSDVMDTVKKCCLNVLRKGDAVSQFSMAQFMLLLYGADEEKGPQIFTRIMEAVRKFYEEEDVIIEYNTQTIGKKKTYYDRN